MNTNSKIGKVFDFSKTVIIYLLRRIFIIPALILFFTAYAIMKWKKMK